LLADTYRQKQDDPDQAVHYYQLFAERYPQSEQLGLVLLKMGYTYEDMQDTTHAKEMYRLLIERQGKTSRLGQLANNRLVRLQK